MTDLIVIFVIALLISVAVPLIFGPVGIKGPQ